MRIVLDTNVLVSGLLNAHGPPAQILNLLLNRKVLLLYDNRVLQEYEEVLKRKKFGFKKEWVEPLLDFIKMEGEYITSEPLPQRMADEGDKKFLEVAVSGGADFMVTGNTIHFPKNEIILTPRKFIDAFTF